ncbi:MAG: hypothetical protein U5J78_07840 [Parasphingorhabdus sp.]|nr:hypothetical protein [Parasphingorhabdus sp.]
MTTQPHRNADLTPAQMEARIVRYADLRPCYNAFIDTRNPGSEAKENFTVIGPGVSENPEQHVHIAEPHGFNIGGARQPPGCVNRSTVMTPPKCLWSTPASGGSIWGNAAGMRRFSSGRGT